MKKAVAVLSALACVATAPLASAQNALRYGDWRVDIAQRYVDVFAANRSGSKIGWLCSRDTEKCVYYLMTDNTCEPGGNGVPALVNSKKGAASINMECMTVGNSYALVFKDYRLIEEILDGGGQVGVAYPLVSGSFQVSRFNTDQFVSAKESAGRVHRTTGGSGPRDARL